MCCANRRNLTNAVCSDILLEMRFCSEVGEQLIVHLLIWNYTDFCITCAVMLAGAIS